MSADQVLFFTLFLLLVLPIIIVVLGWNIWVKVDQKKAFKVTDIMESEYTFGPVDGAGTRTVICNDWDLGTIRCSHLRSVRKGNPDIPDIDGKAVRGYILLIVPVGKTIREALKTKRVVKIERA